MLHYFVHAPEEDLRFVALVVNPGRPLKGPELESVRLAQCRRLLREAHVPQGGILRVGRFRPKYGKHTWIPDVELAKRVKPLVADGLILRGESVPMTAQDGLLELAQLLSGTLFYEANTRSDSLRIKSRTKAGACR